MAKIALVLSGGGATGAFQVGAEKYAREQKGYSWDIIAGVSVGALNGVMLAMEKYEELEQIWQTLSNQQVYTRRIFFWFFDVLRVLFGAKSLFGNKPLWEIIDREAEVDQIKKDLRIGAVSLQTGEYFSFKPTDLLPDEFKRAILASIAMPIAWPPVDISPRYSYMVDGGLRNLSPLGDVLDDDPDEVVVINCASDKPPQITYKPRNVLDIGSRALLDIALNEIMITDTREFIRLNAIIKQAEDKGITLTKPNGKPYKHYSYHIIQPDEPIDTEDVLDFSQESIDRAMEAGWNKAKEVMG